MIWRGKELHAFIAARFLIGFPQAHVARAGSG